MRHPPERRSIHNIGHCARFVDHRRRKSQQDACWLAHGLIAGAGQDPQTILLAASFPMEAAQHLWRGQ
ncbi:MAG: hypothetical protein RR779_18360 [Comamonas sp.]